MSMERRNTICRPIDILDKQNMWYSWEQLRMWNFYNTATVTTSLLDDDYPIYQNIFQTERLLVEQDFIKVSLADAAKES